MPTPNKGESKDEFISRCMGYSDMQKYSQDQRAAICYSKWSEENEEQAVNEKAESRAQQRLMGMVYAYKKGELENPPEKVKQIADGMSLEDAKEYAETKHKGLPSHVEERITRETARSMSFGEFLDYTTSRNLNE